MAVHGKYALAIVLVGVLGASVSHAQFRTDSWRMQAEADRARAMQLERQRRLLDQYERRRAAAHARIRSEESSTLYASTPSPARSQLSCPVEPVAHTPGIFDSIFSERADGTLLISIGDGRPTVPGSRGDSAAPPYWPETLMPVVPQPSAALDLAVPNADFPSLDARDGLASAGTAAVHAIPFLPAASAALERRGFVHVVNHSAQAGEVRIEAVDDSGRRYGPLTLELQPHATFRFDSVDLENGNADKGLLGGTGQGVGDWRLELSSDLDIEALSYIRTTDGLLTAMHDVVPSEGTRHHVATFTPGSNSNQESRLRLVNPGTEAANVAITGIDGEGRSPGDGVTVSIPAGASRTYTAAELESGRGAGLQGSLGDGVGEWQLIVESEQPLMAMSLLSSPSGRLSNLSTVSPTDSDGVHSVPLFPAASDAMGRQGLVRVVNRADRAGEIRIKAYDDTQWDYAPLSLSIGAGKAVQFDSNDLEQGNLAKGLAGSTGTGVGDWRLDLTSDLDIEVLSYVRAWDGFLAAMHDVAPSDGIRHRVALFDPQGSSNQESLLRLINTGNRTAEIAITGVDGGGTLAGSGVSVSIPAGASRTYTAADLQAGGELGPRGSLGDVAGERQLMVESAQPISVMSLVSSSTGHLSNVSTARIRGLPLPMSEEDPETSGEETPEDVFLTEISPIVQSKCVICHVAGGASGEGVSRLQFSPSTVEDHVALNLAVFEAFIAVLGDDETIEDPVAYVLNKVQGVGHGGGLQAAAGTDHHASLDRFLGLLGGAVAPVAITPETLFAGVTMESPRQTLRRAAIVFAGRAPTDDEYAAIEVASEEEGASEAALRTAIRGLMTGPGFHEFLIRAGNDRLFTDRDLGRDLLHRGLFVEYTNTYYDLLVAAAGNNNQGESQRALREFQKGTQYGTGRAPLELIAHVVENDLPYTEILTADYIMANPITANAYGATTEFDDAGDAHEFKPSRIVSYFRDDDSKVQEYSPEFGTRVLDPGDLVTDYPHAGILNTTAFLLRYPTTATNRNRARSRWTYYHFLGLDIEKSASRTTDPAALADTNNPTMHNPACTVCHSVLDPVAGGFQNYGDEGHYRDQWGGLDSLDEFYKRSPAGGEDRTVSALSWDEREIASFNGMLFAGSNTIGLQVILPRDHDFSGWTPHLGIDHLTVRDLNGSLVERLELEEVFADHDRWPSNGEYCGLVMSSDGSRRDSYRLWECLLPVVVEVFETRNYIVEVATWILADDGREADASATLRVWVPGHFYEHGDTWYRDMRTPGFDGGLAPSANNSLQWLASEIVADERFAESAVKFWWPAIMGAEVAEPPENETDADFEARLLASNAQAAEVTRLANGFRSGFREGSSYNARDMLVEIVLSQWFRAESLPDDDPVRRTALANVGARRLLTPEELARKTLALTGFQWGRDRGHNWRAPHERNLSLLTDQRSGYGLLYGGIDSDGITERARDLTSVMAGVAQSHALQSSYPIVMREFYLLPDEDRLLFSGVDRNVLPVTEFSDTFEITAASRSEIETLRLEGHLTAGTINISLAFLNDFWDEDLGDRDVLLDRLTVRRGVEVIHQLEMEEHEHPDCSHIEQNAFHLSGSGFNCVLNVPVDIPSDATYQVEILAWADQAGGELARLAVVVESDTKRSAGANRIKAKLVELFDKLHGIHITADSPEVQDVYALFVEVWERKRGAYSDHFLYNEENIRNGWPGDDHFFDGIADHLWRQELNENGNELGWDWDAIGDFFDEIDWSDPHAVARTWTVVLAYLMMDYRYLYL